MPPPTRPGAVTRPGVPSAGNPFPGDFDGSGMHFPSEFLQEPEPQPARCVGGSPTAAGAAPNPIAPIATVARTVRTPTPTHEKALVANELPRLGAQTNGCATSAKV